MFCEDVTHAISRYAGTLESPIDKYTAKTIFESLCSTYEGNQQVINSKANLIVQHHEMFIMKYDEDTKTMFYRF